MIIICEFIQFCIRSAAEQLRLRNARYGGGGPRAAASLSLGDARPFWYRYEFILDDQPTRAHTERKPSLHRATETAPQSASQSDLSLQ
eukprot:2889187-Pleurochrysis_carterae.AAC.3